MKVSRAIPDEDLSIKGYEPRLTPLQCNRRAIGIAVGADTGQVYGKRTLRNISEKTGRGRVSIYGVYHPATITVTELIFPKGGRSTGAILLVEGM